MRIAIIGAGAIGCYLGARLARHGHEVIVQGRPEQVAALRAQDLLIHLPDGRVERQALRATTALATEPDFTPDVILLTVKTQDIAEACAPLAQIATRAPIVTLQNGLRADELAAQVVGRGRVVGGVVMSAIAYLRPGEIEAQFPGWLIVGEPWGHPGARARELRDLLNDATPTFIARDLAAVRWSKLIANLNNGLCAATDLPLSALARSPLGRRLSLAVMREGAAVAHAQGIHLDHGLYGLAPRMLRRNPGTAPLALLNGLMPALLGRLPAPLAERIIGLTARSALGRLPVRGSTWQSIARGRATEIDYLNGEISRRGHALGVRTPVNDLVTAAVREVAATRQFVTLETLRPTSDVAVGVTRSKGGMV
ncbi:MAG TPA: 2-dehydropantoate 2-reductase [Ktedonobacterales bacterium]|jgi:2-dehydropantoate 2-reductase|nr:2-dehydropantoate 2-reductase [Ktedonobacterales bacterium]